jgi:hypothetical protein
MIQVVNKEEIDALEIEKKNHENIFICSIVYEKIDFYWNKK